MSDLVERRGRWPAVVLCGWRGHQWDVTGTTDEFESCRRCGMRRRKTACDWCGYRVLHPCQTQAHRANCENA